MAALDATWLVLKGIRMRFAKFMTSIALVAVIGSAQANLLTFSAETYPFDTYVQTTHIAWGSETLSGLIDLQSTPYQTTTNPNTGEVVSRFALAGQFTYGGQTQFFESGSFLAVSHNPNAADSYSIHPYFQPFSLTGNTTFVAFHLENTVSESLSVFELPDFGGLTTIWSFVNGNIGVPSEGAIISYSGHDFVISTASTIPLPPTALLMASALGLLGLSRRNRNAN